MDNCKEGIWKRRTKLLKTVTWRLIATTTTFSVAMALTNDVGKAGSVAAIDTVLKTIFYYFHEGCYDKAEKKKCIMCYEEPTSTDTENEVTVV